MAPVAPPLPKPNESSVTYRQRVQAWRADHETATMRVFTAVMVCFLVFMVAAFVAARSYQPHKSAERPEQSRHAPYSHPDRLCEFLYDLEN